MLPTDLATIAGRRLGDARVLADTGDDERAGGAMYLEGLAVEIWLKGLLIRRPDGGMLVRRHDLVWRHHDLDGLCRNFLASGQTSQAMMP